MGPVRFLSKEAVDWLKGLVVVGITAKVICDSYNGKRLTTMELRYPRIIHSEFMTHRAFSRNAESSRARPFDAMVQAVMDDPFVPLSWGTEKPGMQAGEPLSSEEDINLAKSLWLDALHRVIDGAMGLRDEKLLSRKVHKSIVNRLLEPWSYITVVCTATEWSNFFRLRLHGDAEVHFQALARAMKAALDESVPVERTLHLPYIEEGYNLVRPTERMGLVSYAAMCEGDSGSRESINNDGLLRAISEFVVIPSQWDVLGNSAQNLLAMVSTARCSRVSYLKQGKAPTLVEDLAQFERLVTGSGFGHWSPHEHIGVALESINLISGNFNGWGQYRKFFIGKECG